MKSFSQFGIEPDIKSLVGDKIKMDRILNREIVVEDFLIVPSKFTEGNKDCLHVQISIGENKHIVFTGSNVLINMIKKVSKEDFPFKTTIIKSNEYFKFT
jgi:hypothetical protein